MPSLRAHVFDWIIRWQVKPKLARAAGDVAAVRRIFDQANFPDPPGIVFREGQVGGIPGEWAERPGLAPDAPRLFYLHGGGFIGCSPRTHRPLTGGFAMRGFRVFCPDYRLAPEHPFPAALDDAASAWSAFAAAGPAGIAGDSAGGNLSLALMLRARRDGLPLPSAAVLFSPSTDMLGEGESMRSNARRDAMFDPRSSRTWSRPISPGTIPPTRSPRRSAATSPGCRRCCSMSAPGRCCATIRCVSPRRRRRRASPPP